MVNIRKAKEELKMIRDKMNGMNSTQLSNLFKPFSPERLKSIRKALDKAISAKKTESIAKRRKEIQKLEKEIETIELE